MFLRYGTLVWQFCDSGMIFFGSRSYFLVGFGSGSGSRSCFGSYGNFFNILDINFTFVFLSCLVSVLGCSLRRDRSFLGKYLFDKKEFALSFKIGHFWWEIVKFYQFFRVVLLHIHFKTDLLGSGMIFFWIRILLKVSDLTGSGSTKMWIGGPDPHPSFLFTNFYLSFWQNSETCHTVEVFLCGLGELELGLLE